jgi:UMF1 family MFS transporter
MLIKRVQAFWFLAVLVGLPFPIMLLVDVGRGREEGNKLAKKLEEGSRERDETYVEEDNEVLDEGFSYQHD